ncbi:GNAT family acetyltransferase [Nitrincola sp. A-D6]|uniref:GNAT family N-acetyltransferase n=1 Tax=Nitrincola sp. A-D6 TaxID=1545442 RepID=UPI00051FA958|nr:GNAT family acetyltransferase [Nitrincola sp. A-D6]
MIHISEYKPENRRAVIDLILHIQNNEFGIPITEDQQPDLQDIQRFYQHGDGNFWISLHQDTIVGTISLLDIGNGESALRKMFVRSEFRGQEYGVSSSLLHHALSFARSNGVERIYLGTTAQFLAAHRFYEKNGFVEIAQSRLPVSFPIMAVDSRFYMYAF